MPVISELAKQLYDWRDALPPHMRWEDDATLGSSQESLAHTPVELEADGLSYQMLDPRLILTANLQTRYKFALYLIHRPYIYKALHTPDQVTAEDLKGCAMALRVSPLLSVVDD
jgi:hypothetical protein